MAVLTVGSGSGYDYSTISAAVAASQDGDVIQVESGTYTNDFPTVTTSITIEGVGGMANLVATEPPSNEKGIMTIGSGPGNEPNVTLTNLSFSGAEISADDGGNGAGIRYQSGNLTINNSYFYNNQDGILANADANGNITINNTEFDNNGNANPPSSGIEHNLYIGDIASLKIDNSYFTDPIVGSDIKSRAAATTIENSRIYDPNGTGENEIDLPNGGTATIENNVMEKGANADNPYFIQFGEEGNLQTNSTLSVTGNAVENDYGSGATFINNQGTADAVVNGNTFYGLSSSQVDNGTAASASNNTYDPQSSEPALDTSPPYVACFAAGTRILTANNRHVTVENLRIGDKVVVARAMPRKTVLRPVKWIGYRHIDLTRHADPRAARPIRVMADAFADGAPLRDLVLSPDHAVHVDGRLIPIRLLQNGATIARDDRVKEVVYYHVELDQHDILLAEGLEAESYLETGNRSVFQNADVPMVLHPDFTSDHAQARREAESCAPFVADPDRVAPVWHRLAIRASLLGYGIEAPATTTDPALRLFAAGRTVEPVARAGNVITFLLPSDAQQVRLVSRATAPCEHTPWIEDMRRLGVAVGRIVLFDRFARTVVPPDHPDLKDGWWAAERDGTKLWRWTNGSAALNLPPGVIGMEVHLAGEATYVQEAEPAAPPMARVA